MLTHGRSEALALLERRLEPVLSRRVGVALAIWGEPGIGKSHAARQVLGALPCRHLSLGATAPLAAFAARLPASGRLPGWAGVTLSHLEAHIAVEPPRALEALGAALAGLAPFVLHLEDLHEASEERLALLLDVARVVRRVRGAGLFVTSRTEPPAPFEGLRLGPLSQPETDRALMAEVGAVLPAEALAWIWKRAQGNPLFALEHFRFLSRQGHLWSDGHRWHWRAPEQERTPPTLEALVELLLEGASRDERQQSVLRARAFLPGAASRDAARSVSGLSETAFAAAERALEGRGVLSQGAFAHPLYREVARQATPPAERQRLAARSLEELRSDPVQAAQVMAEADLTGEAALELLARAAAAARAAGDDLAAAHLLARSSEHAAGEKKGELALEAAKLFEGRDYPQMLALAGVAEAHLADSTEALFLRASALAVLGDFGAAQAVLVRLPPEARDGPEWLARYLRLLHQSGKNQQLVETWEANLERMRPDPNVLYYVGWAYLNLGRPRAAAALLGGVSDPDALRELGELRAAIAFFEGRYDEAVAIYDELLAWHRADPAAPRHATANLLRNRAVTRMQQGEYRGTLDDLQAALAIYQDIGHGLHYAQTLVMSSYVHQELGDYERAEEVLTEALDIFRRAEPQPFLAHALVQLSDLYLEWPGLAHPFLALKRALEAVAVLRELHAGEPPPDLPDAITARCALARAYTATGQPAEGLRLATDALGRATALHFAEAMVAASCAKGDAHAALGELTAARDAYRLSCEQAEAHGLDLYVHKVGLELDRLSRDAASAARHLAWFEARGLLSGVNLAKRYFPELDIPATAAPPATAALEVLGPMRVVRTGEALPVRGQKRRELLACLLAARLRGRSEVSQLELLDALYPNLPEPAAADALKQLVYQLRRASGAALVESRGSGYALGDLDSDAEAFLRSGDPLLWRGPCLPDVPLELAESVRAALHAALAAEAEARLEHDAGEAARLAAILAEEEPYDRAALSLSLRALRAAGDPQALARRYAEARARFAEVGEALPERWEDFLGAEG